MEGINEMSNDECITNSDIDFCSFYYTAVKRLLDIDSKANVSYLYRYAKIFIKYYDIFCQLKFGYEDHNDTIVQLLKDSFHYRVIYVYKNAVLLTSAVAFHFRNVYRKDPKSIERLVNKKLVKICSIGGCSIPDIVAIVTVLKYIATESEIELDFRVTFIDFNADWKNTCITVLSCLEEFYQATWKIDFIESDLANTNTWTTKVLQAIQEADVITIVRFVSNLKVKCKIVKKLCKKLKYRAMLLILDRPSAKLIESCFRIANKCDFHLSHAELYDYHTLDIEAVKHFECLYRKHFRDDKYLQANVSLNLFVCVWMKASSEMCTDYSNNLGCLFQSSTEKYNSRQNFLIDEALTKWENSLTKKKEAAGWNAKNINKFVQKRKEKRINKFKNSIPKKMKGNLLQNYLLTQAQSLAGDGKDFSEINEKSLYDYLYQKKQYSLIMKNAYFSSLSANNLRSNIG